MNYAVLLEGSSIPPESIIGFTIIFDIELLFLKGKLTLRDTIGVLFNEIQTGNKITIIFGEGSKAERIYDMKISGFSKRTDGTGYIMEDIEVELVSAWYFSQEPLTKKFFGTSSKIILDVLDKNDYFERENIKIENSTDNPISRYCLGKLPTKFLSELSKVSLAGESPMYLYMDKKQNINLKSWDSMRLSYLNSFLSPQKRNEGDGKSIYAKEGEFLIETKALSFSSEPESLSSKRQYSLPTEHLTHGSYERIITTSKENLDVPAGKISPFSDKNHFGWWVNPSDAVSLGLRDHLEKEFKLRRVHTITNSLIISDVDIGNSIDLKIPLDDADSAGQGRYVIRRIEEIWTQENSYSRLTLNKL